LIFCHLRTCVEPGVIGREYRIAQPEEVETTLIAVQKVLTGGLRLLPSCDCMAADLAWAVVADGSASGREPPRVVLILTCGGWRWTELGLERRVLVSRASGWMAS